MRRDEISCRTPYYLFDFDAAAARAAKIQSMLPANATLCYAVKANAFLLRALKNLDGVLFEVCSEGELEICRHLAVSPDRIVFSGVMKNREMIKKALDFGVRTVTIESEGHLDDLLSALPDGRRQEVILRLSSGNQFGMSRTDIVKCAGRIRRHGNLALRGIHYFSGTQKKIAKIMEEVSFIEEFCGNLKRETAAEFSCIEYGPGLAFDYFAKEDAAEDYGDLAAFCEAIKGSAFNYVVELGRFVASPCGEYHTEICDIKTTDGTAYVIIDGGINHVNYYGQIMAMKVPPVTLVRNAESESGGESAAGGTTRGCADNAAAAGGTTRGCAGGESAAERADNAAVAERAAEKAAPNAERAAAGGESAAERADNAAAAKRAAEKAAPNAESGGPKETREYCLCGSLCTTADVIAKKIPLDAPQKGDELVFRNIGAYSVTEGIYLFLSHDLPAVLARQGGAITVLRKSAPTYIMNA